jgi:hypothetical protein
MTIIRSALLVLLVFSSNAALSSDYEPLPAGIAHIGFSIGQKDSCENYRARAENRLGKYAQLAGDPNLTFSIFLRKHTQCTTRGCATGYTDHCSFAVVPSDSRYKVTLTASSEYSEESGWNQCVQIEKQELQKPETIFATVSSYGWITNVHYRVYSLSVTRD